MAAFIDKHGFCPKHGKHGNYRYFPVSGTKESYLISKVQQKSGSLVKTVKTVNNQDAGQSEMSRRD